MSSRKISFGLVHNRTNVGKLPKGCVSLVQGLRKGPNVLVSPVGLQETFVVRVREESEGHGPLTGAGNGGTGEEW